MNKVFECLLCNEIFEKQKHLIFHLKKIHVYPYQEYVIENFFNGIHPTCKCGCGTLMLFESSNPQFFNEYTKNHFPRKPHTEETKRKIKETYIRVMMDKYGVDNPMKLQEFIDKIGDTKEKNHGDRKFNNQEKSKKTFLDKYGDEKFRNTEKMMETNFKRFGAKTFTSTSEGKVQVKKTKKDKYGDENYVNVEKIRRVKLEKYGYECEFENTEWRNKYNRNYSKIQLRVETELPGNKFRFSRYEFDIRFDRFIIEVDGLAYHPETMSDLSLIQLNSVINDFKKTNLIENSEYKLIRVRAEELHKIQGNITFEDIWNLSYEQNFQFGYFTKVVNKSTLKKYIDRKGSDNLKKYKSIFLKFIRTFNPEFPKIETNENLGDLIKKIRNYDLSRILTENTFDNNCSYLGNSYLKSKFNSYWKSSYKNNKSPVDAWNDNKIMQRVIDYRIGLNNSNEIFDFSLHQLIRGLSANRFTVSFFKPVLAAAIYKKFIGDISNPVVFDPCCGFGGRLLGFKSVYPNGSYFGCEPNIETYNELMELSKNFLNVHLFNCKVEDFRVEQLPEIDLTFTSIPYYDIETYSNQVSYLDFDDWKNTFLEKIKSLPNLLINIPEGLRPYFENDCNEFFISSNTSHFNSTSNKKIEYLLQFQK